MKISPACTLTITSLTLSLLKKERGPPFSLFAFSPKTLKQSKTNHHQTDMGLGFLLLLLLAVIGAVSGASPAPKSSKRSTGGGSIYDHLRQYGLPIGILPKGITKYSLDDTNGEFRVFLPQPCHAKFENQVRYDFNVSGTLSFGRVADLSGVSAQELFLWFPVKGIRVDVPSSGLIYFDVGVVDKQFSLSLFESPPDCTALDPSDPSSSSNYASAPASSSSSSDLNLNLKNEPQDVGERSELKAAS